MLKTVITYKSIWNLDNSWLKIEDKTQTGQPIHRCSDNDHWTGPNTDLKTCKERCAGYLYMTFVARGDKNCACQNFCKKVFRDVNCDLYQSGKIFHFFDL